MALIGQGNGNGRAGDSSESQAAIVRRKFAVQCGLAEDDPILPLIQANAQLEMKVEQWSTAILELAELARQQNQAMQETSRNSLALTNVLGSSAKDSQQLQQLIARLDSSLAALKQSTSKGSSEVVSQSMVQTLMPMLDELKAKLSDTQKAIERSDRGRQVGSGSPEWLQLLAGAQTTVLLFLLLGGFWAYFQMSKNQLVLWQEINWTRTKLERVEKALGTDPKQ